MHRLKFGSIIGALALAAGLMVLAVQPASAIVTSGCTPTAGGGGGATGGTVGAGASAAVVNAEIGEFPAIAAAQSFLRVACTFTNAQASAKYTIHDFTNAFYHQGEARTVTVGAVGTAVGGSNITVNAASAAALTGFVNHGISGQGVPKLAFIKTVAGTTLTIDTPVVAADPANPATSGPIAAGAVLKIDNGTARSVADGATTSASLTVTSLKANFKVGALTAGGDVGASLTGTNIKDNCTIATVNSASSVTLSAGCGALATSANQTLAIGGATQTTTARTVNDGLCQASNKISSAAAVFDGLGQGDIGMPISGTCIAAGAVITAIVGNVATVSATVTVNALTTNVITIGGASRTAPPNGDTILNQAAMLDLSPSLVPGSGACSLQKPEGFAIEGGWNNPGSFDPNTNLGAFHFGDQPAATAAIAQILFKTSVVSFAAYIIQRPTGDATIVGTAHYDITFPNVPTSLAICSGSTTGIGSSIGVNATTIGQASIPNGVGRPSTAQARSTRPLATGTATVTARYKSDDATHPFNIPSNCLINSTPVVDFHCGHG